MTNIDNTGCTILHNYITKRNASRSKKTKGNEKDDKLTIKDADAEKFNAVERI